MDWTVIGVTFMVAALLGWFARYAYRRTRPAADRDRPIRRCDWPRCRTRLPKGALRTHDGHWRCARHKAVGCAPR